MVSAYY